MSPERANKEVLGMQQEKQIESRSIELTSKELVVMGNLFLSREFPHNSLTLEEVAIKLNMSRATAASVMKGLVKKGCVTRVKSFISFYYPVADRDIRRLVLVKLGLLSGE